MLAFGSCRPYASHALSGVNYSINASLTDLNVDDPRFPMRAVAVEWQTGHSNLSQWWFTGYVVPHVLHLLYADSSPQLSFGVPDATIFDLRYGFDGKGDWFKIEFTLSTFDRKLIEFVVLLFSKFTVELTDMRGLNRLSYHSSFRLCFRWDFFWP